MNWEGAELCYYANGESNAISLSNVQFAMIVKILGLEIEKDGTVCCFSDEALKQMAAMKSNPLKLQTKK